CSWPVKNSMGKRVRIGECHCKTISKGGVYQIYISPLLSDSVKVIDVLTHEMVHAVAGCEHGHKGLFVTICKMIGLTKNKPPYAADNDSLLKLFAKWVEEIGEYPHYACTPIQAKKERKVANRSIAITCPLCQ